MSIKAITLAAVALLGTATLATASESYFSLNSKAAAASSIDLGVVRAADNGIVEIYDYHRGEIGTLLGTAPVKAGANREVKVNVGTPPLFDVIAVLNVNGQVVAQSEIDIVR